jgi:ubiquinol-cytochrome c reductase iron-sulfur subunit
MSDDKDQPKTSYDAGGDVTERLRSPVPITGEGVSEQENAAVSRADAAAGPLGGGVEGEGAVLRGGQPGAPAGGVGGYEQRYLPEGGTAPSRHVGGRVVEEPPEEVYPAPFETPPRRTDVDPKAAKRLERIVAGLFLLPVIGVVLVFFAVFRWQPTEDGLAALRNQNMLIGIALFLALGGIGAGAVAWARGLMSGQEYVQKRHPFTSSEQEIGATIADLDAGVADSGLPRRSLIKRSLGLSLGLLPLAALPFLRDLGPLPHNRLRTTAWKPGLRLVDEGSGQPVRLGDLRIGGMATVIPEDVHGHTELAKAATLLIRTRPGELHGDTRMDWTVDGHVAYSKICTHAGCPISLYEQQTKHLFCPCHQSTFDIVDGAHVIFGPAARPLPQLPIAVDDEGYFIATSDYGEPVGPSFWERG